VTDFAISTNLISWVLAKKGIFGWPTDDAEAEVIERMQLGDRLVPKFAQHPDFGGKSQVDYVKALCEALELEYEQERTDYEQRVAVGAGAVPFVWTVMGQPGLDTRPPNDVPWITVKIEQENLRFPLSTGEFLRLRSLPIEIARQFKAMAAPGRHIQALPGAAANDILGFGERMPRPPEALRRLSIVRDDDPSAHLHDDGSPLSGDFVFIVGRSMIDGFFVVEDGLLTRAGQPISMPPRELPALIERAKARARKSDDFRPANAVAAARELANFAASNEVIRDVPEFGTFYDCYVLLPKKVSQALELAARDSLQDGEPPAEEMETPEDGEATDGEQAELDNLHGLTVSSVDGALVDISLPDSVLAEAVTALRAGKHLLLSGPPGTGKSTIATALCKAVVGEEFDVATATADWTTFETIGGYMPRGGDELEFEPGLVLRALQRGRWLVVDEINRADIDKAFGPLFTLLADSGNPVGEDVVLPYRKGERNIRIVRAERRAGADSTYAMTPVWRLIGTLNARDKAALFQLSFAFLRRFAVVDVPLPAERDYRRLYEGWSGHLDDDSLVKSTDAAMKLAFGRRQLGPAILKDVAEFTKIALVPTDTASREASYEDPVVAFLTAARLYAAPQYEGARKADVDDLLHSLRGVWESPPDRAWAALEQSLYDVCLS
jgi:MoxR-like ATPase